MGGNFGRLTSKTSTTNSQSLRMSSSDATFLLIVSAAAIGGYLLLTQQTRQAQPVPGVFDAEYYADTEKAQAGAAWNQEHSVYVNNLAMGRQRMQTQGGTMEKHMADILSEQNAKLLAIAYARSVPYDSADYERNTQAVYKSYYVDKTLRLKW